MFRYTRDNFMEERQTWGIRRAVCERVFSPGCCCVFVVKEGGSRKNFSLVDLRNRKFNEGRQLR